MVYDITNRNKKKNGLRKENILGESVVTPMNRLNYQYIEETEVKEITQNKKE